MTSVYRLNLFTGVVIVFCWGASVFDGFLTSDYHALDVTTPVMIVFAGYLFGDAVIRKKFGDAS